MKLKIRLFSAALLFLSFHFTISAQEEGSDIVIGKSYTIASKVLDESRPYQVYLPKDYDSDGQALSVMYLLDGDHHFHHTTGIVSFLKNRGQIPNMMVVAIPNTNDRTRDLTPKVVKDENTLKEMPTAGGADKMLAFIKDELMPHIESTYNVGAYNLLVGHSFGGLFAVHTLLSEPELFDSYIAISPSMWWDEQNLVDRAEVFLSEQQDLDCYFYMTMGNEDKDMLGGAMKLAALFEESDEEKLLWDFKVMKEETHGTIPHRSTYLGLVQIFKDLYTIDISDVYASSGLEGVMKHFDGLNEKFGTEMNPAEAELNKLGYLALGKGNLDDALSIFLKNIEIYPKSFNVYDSAGEAYMLLKQDEKAIEFYKKSLQLNPGNNNAVKMLENLGVKHDPSELAIELSREGQEKFTAEYKISLGGIMTIQIEEGALKASHPAIPTQTMLYYGDNLFLLTPENVPMQFLVDKEGNGESFEVQLNIGMRVSGSRID